MRRKFQIAVSFAITAVIVGAGVSGCIASPEDADPAAGAADTVYRTIVRFAPDGSFAPTYEAVTPAQQQAEMAARAAFVEASRTSGRAHPQVLPTLIVDSGCAGASLWLFDQTNRGGNQLCLFKAAADDMAWLDLGTLCRNPSGRCIGTWANAVRSLWAGADPGSLQSCTSTLCFTTPFLNFTAFQQINSVAAGTTHPLNWAFLFTP
jgi:hypothetical protein